MKTLAFILCLGLLACGAPRSRPVPLGPGAPPPPPAGYIYFGTEVTPPGWLPADDVPNLLQAVEEYERDAGRFLGNWAPEPGDASRLPLRLVFHDVQGLNIWDPGVRTGYLHWPRGPGGKPLRTGFAPYLHQIYVLDFRREYGFSGIWSQLEIDCAARGRTLPVTIPTRYPGLFE